MNKITIKLVLMGDGGVGKTSLRRRYLGKGFSNEYLQTLGADFAIKNIQHQEHSISLQIWDLAGQSEFQHVRTMYFKMAAIGVIVFDITHIETMKNLPYWLENFWTHNGQGKLPVIIVGNKIDLRETKTDSLSKEQSLEYIRSVMGSIPFEYIETSAQTGENVDLTFETALQQCFTRLLPQK